MRSCGAPLERRAHTYVCPRGHAYDVARTGYVNLLQPQDRRSPAAGDSKAAVDARASLLASGVGQIVIDDFVHRAAALDIGRKGVVVDLGCGTGDALARLAKKRGVTTIGIDLSTTAIERAARSYPDLTWVVANADRRLPILDDSVQLVLSLHARRNPVECSRVLTSPGFLLVAVPAEDDLIELREVVQGQAVKRQRADALVAEHDALFALVERSVVRERRQLDRAALIALLRGTYRGARGSASARVQALDRLDVTLASEVFLFARRTQAAG